MMKPKSLKGVLKKSSKENLQHPTNLVSKFDCMAS